jgi:hypothetical protein
MFENLKDWKTTLTGVLLVLASLPTLDWLQPILGNTRIARYVFGVAGIATGLISIFGISSKPKG